MVGCNIIFRNSSIGIRIEPEFRFMEFLGVSIFGFGFGDSIRNSRFFVFLNVYLRG